MNVHAAIYSALEALEVGDVRLAVEILLTALEDGDVERRLRCEGCGARFAWPGELDHHRRFSHWQAAA